MAVVHSHRPASAPRVGWRRREGVRRPATRRWLVALASALVASSGLVASLAIVTAGAPPAAALGAPGGKDIPLILGFSSSTGALPAKGGTITLSASVKYASKCSIYVTPTFQGFTSTRNFGCASGKLVTKVSIAAQKIGKLFGFTLVAVGSGGSTDSSEVPVGVGIAPPPFAFSPGNLVLPTQGVGLTSPPVSVTVTNTSAQPESIGGLSIAGGSASTDFELNAGTCVGAALSAHETCSFSIVFDPKESGERNTFVVLDYDEVVRDQELPETLDMHVGGEAEYAFVALNGPDLTEPKRLQPRISFGTDAYGITTSPPQQVKLTNAGSVPLVITGASVVSGDIEDFGVTSSCTATIDVGQDCLITATFTAQQTGARSALLELTDNAKGGATQIELLGTGAYATTSLTGTGLTRARPLGFNLNFGSSPVGVQDAVTITITNTSPKGVILRFTGETLAGTNPGDFSFSPGNCAAGGDEMLPGSSCTFQIAFEPTLPVPRQATLTIEDNTADLGELFNLSGVGSGTA